MSSQQYNENWFFTQITKWPKAVLFLCFTAIFFTASFVPNLHKDTTSDAFIAADDEVILYRAHVRETFGLEDPIAVAVINDGPKGIFNDESLTLLSALTQKISELPNVDPDKIISLATESNIVGTDDGMEVEDFINSQTVSQVEADNVKMAIDNFPLYQGALVARDGSATLIVVEMIDQQKSEETYQQIMQLVADTNIPSGNEVHVAGEGAIAGYLATYIDNDAQVLNPTAGLVITIILLIAFRTLSGTLLPNLIVLGTVAGTLGLMAASGVSFYVITNGLATILIGISVADSIHILGQYYEEQSKYKDLTARELTMRAMSKMWKPVTLTSLTTIAGFLGLYIAAEMPPMRYFGLFAALGVALAWLYSMTLLPAMLTLINIKPSKLFSQGKANDQYGQYVQKIGMAALAKPRLTISIALVVALFGSMGALRVTVQENQIQNFQTDEPLYIADKEINRRMDGTYYLDIVVETEEIEGLYEPTHLRRIEELQNFVEGLDAINGSTSIVDYVKQMNKSVNENRQAFYTIPDNADLIAQLFFLYTASGSPTDFEEEVDYDYKQANIRVNFPVADYQLLTKIVPTIQSYVDNEFNTEEIKATLSGRVAVNHKWLKTIANGHLYSVGLSLLFVFIAAAIVFRSFIGGLYSLVPVVSSLLLVYAVMGFSGIWLGVGTSMFSAIAIGLGIDFSIHTLDRMKELLRDPDSDFDEKMKELFPSTGRALFFNFAALAFGFMVLTTSEVPPLIKFGLLVVVAVTASFISGLTVLPALVKVMRPAFLIPSNTLVKRSRSSLMVASMLFLLFAGIVFSQFEAKAEDDLDANQIIFNVNNRDEGEWVSRNLLMELIDKRGKVRERNTKGYRRYFGAEKRTVLVYTSPTRMKGTGFLTYDYPDPKVDDDQWLYLPALRKIRRISAADRGDYFLGTDLSYEDIKKEGKITYEDYTFTIIGTEVVDGFPTVRIEGTPVSKDVMRELGYGRVIWSIDPAIWISRKVEIWDVNQNPLKVILNKDIKEIEGIWSTHEISVDNLKSKHKTNFIFSDISYDKEVKPSIFEQTYLKRQR